MTNPTIGVWLSEDGSIGAPDPSNPRRYVGNNPTNLVDPTGLAAQKPTQTFEPTEDDKKEMKKWEDNFPGLVGNSKIVGSITRGKPNLEQNCIAYCAGVTFKELLDKKKQKEAALLYPTDWGTGENFRKGLQQFCTAFGFEIITKTTNPKEIEKALTFEKGVLKMAVYAEVDDKGNVTECKHGAIQQPNEGWRSKMGSSVLIEHKNAADLAIPRKHQIIAVLQKK